MELIKVAIGDPNTLLREGLKRIFSAESDLLVVGEAADEFDITEIVETTHPDVLLLDLNIPRRQNAPIVIQLSQTFPDTKVLILALHPEKDNILNAAKAGAWGCALKRTLPATLLQAIRKVHRGEIWVDPETGCAEMFIDFVRQTQRIPGDGLEDRIADMLSKRELEILNHVAKGFTNQEISKTLFISLRTVKVHLNHIFNKLNVNNRTQAALLLVQTNRHESLDKRRWVSRRRRVANGLPA